LDRRRERLDELAPADGREHAAHPTPEPEVLEEPVHVLHHPAHHSERARSRDPAVAPPARSERAFPLASLHAPLRLPLRFCVLRSRLRLLLTTRDLPLLPLHLLVGHLTPPCQGACHAPASTESDATQVPLPGRPCFDAHG